MNEPSQPSMRVEPLQYEQVTGAHIWPELFKAMGLAALLYGVAMVCSGITYLSRLTGSIGSSGGITFLLVYVIPNVALGVAWIVAAIGVLNNTGPGISIMRIILIGVLVATAIVAVLRLLRLFATGTPTLLYSAATSAVNVLLQSALPLLCLGIIRIHRRGLQPGM